MKRLCSCLALVLCCLVAAGSSFAQTAIGYVLEIEGTWLLNGSKQLHQGEKVPAGGTIRRRSNSSSDRITIADLQQAPIGSARRDCSEGGGCDGTILLPASTPPYSFWSAVSETARSAVNGVVEKILPAPRRRSIHASRSGDLSDEVIRSVNGNVDLRPAVKVQGAQYLRFRTVGSLDPEPSKWSDSTKINDLSALPFKGTGLFEINLLRSNGTNFEPVASAWILVAEKADFEKANDAFREIRNLTDQWGDKVRPETLRLFHQAALEMLAAKP